MNDNDLLKYFNDDFRSIEGFDRFSLKEHLNNTLDIAKRYNLELDVIIEALILLKENPNMNIEDALYNALIEWDL
jgi:hypothetical protein